MVTSAPSSAWERLAQAIAVYDEAVSTLERVNRARTMAVHPADIGERLEEAEAEVKRAKALSLSHPRLIAEALGEDLPPDAVADAEQRVADLKAAIERAWVVQNGLSEATDEARRRLDTCQNNVVSAAEAVIAEAPKMLAADDRMKAAMRQAAYIQGVQLAVAHVAPRALPPGSGDVSFEKWREDAKHRAIPVWRAAFEALKTDPNAELPEI